LPLITFAIEQHKSLAARDTTSKNTPTFSLSRFSFPRLG
jgi:hypothetical protein